MSKNENLNENVPTVENYYECRYFYSSQLAFFVKKVALVSLVPHIFFSFGLRISNHSPSNHITLLSGRQFRV